MDNWQYHDKKMKELKQLYLKISKQTQNRLQEIFDSIDFTFDNLYNIADKEHKNRINTYIEEWKDKGLLTGYFGMLAKNIYSRTRVKNSEILELLIYGAYIEEQNKIQEQELNIMYDDANYYYEQGQQEVNNALPKKERKPIDILKWALFLALMDEPNVKGYIYEQYIQATIQFNAQQIYRQMTIDLQQQKQPDITNDIYQNLIKRQNNSKLNINGDKISGDIDTQLIGVNNLAKVEGIKAVDNNAQVRFIAVIDGKETDMCHSLDNQLFYIDKENTFNRYYGETQAELRMQRVRCKGLVLGLNLPPISHHFHWCRSTIIYNTNYKSNDFRNGNILGEEQYRALEQYLKSQSYKINEKLYSGIELNDDDKEYISNLDEALKRMPTYKGWVNRSVYVRDSDDVIKVLSIFDNEQRIGHWSSYISSSLNIYDTGFKMIIKIKSKTGRNLSTLNDEGGGEILFPRNTDFQLIDIKNKNGIIYVKLEEV